MYLLFDQTQMFHNRVICSEIDLALKTNAVNQILKGLLGTKIFQKSIRKILLLKNMLIMSGCVQLT